MRDMFHQSKFSKQYDGNKVICPYCSHSYEPESEDYSEDTRAEDCSECGKSFRLHQVFTVDHSAEPDCELNGEQHDWDTEEGGRGYERCGTCDQMRLIRKKPSDTATNSGPSL